MKKIIIFIFSICFSPIYSQVYYQQDFNLSDNVKNVAVLCYKLTIEDDEIIESFPYSIQRAYKTDLNLHYLEFYSDGKLRKSRLFYPRDFYGQFSLLSPNLDLESSDFGEKINYLTKSYRYEYEESRDLLTVKLTEENDTEINILLKDDFMIEDNYYTYTENEHEGVYTLVKKRKDSDYGFRRIEKVEIDGKIVQKEYINNRFLIAKESSYKTDSRSDNIRVTQSRINLNKQEFNEYGQIIRNYEVDLSWRNKFPKWPDIDFNIEYNYDTYLDDLEREFTQIINEFLYDDQGRMKQKKTYSLSNNKNELIQSENFNYDSEGKLILHQVDNNYKEYEYDKFGNWIIKIIGELKDEEGSLVRVPHLKYVRTLTYFN